MRVTQEKNNSLGRRTKYPVSYFNIDSIYFSDESVVSDVLYADRIKIIKHQRGIRIKATAFDTVYYIDLPYDELSGIVITDPDVCDMPKRDQSGIGNAIFGWVGGLVSLHDQKLRIGGSVELHYCASGANQEIILYHTKQDIFDMFKFIRRHFGSFLLDRDV